MDSVDEKLDAFNDLFLTCLNAHAPVKTVKPKRKSNPFITDDIKDLMTIRKVQPEKSSCTTHYTKDPSS